MVCADNLLEKVVTELNITIKDAGLKKLRTYYLNKKVKSFRKELKEKKTII